MKTNKIRVNLKKTTGNPGYRIISIRGDLFVPDWDTKNREIPVSPGNFISKRSAEYLVNTPDVYDVTVTG